MAKHIIRGPAALLGLVACLIPGSHAAPPIQAQEPQCWQLVAVQADFQRTVPGGLEPIDAEFYGFPYSFTIDGAPQWLMIDDDYEDTFVFARAEWSTPPTTFCAGDVVPYSQRFDNIVPGSGTGDVATLEWGPRSFYSTDRTCEATGSTPLILKNNQNQTQVECSGRLVSGQPVLDAPSTWHAQVQIGDMVVDVAYHYLPVTTVAPPAAVPEPVPMVDVPLSSQQTELLYDIGYPDAFDIVTMEGPDGKTHRYESWRYFRQNIAFVFIDGVFSFDAWEAYPPGGVWPVTVSPDQFPLGVSKQAVMARFDNRQWQTATSSVMQETGLDFLVSEQLVLGFENDQLVYVEAIAIPLEEGIQ